MLTTKGNKLRISNQGISMAPQALAELTPIVPQAYYYADHLGMELEYQYALYGAIYQRDVWVHTCVDKRANAVARLPVNCWDVNSDTRRLDTRSEYAQLLSDPCEFMDSFKFWHWVQSTIDIYGETYLAIQRSKRGTPEKLWPLHPSRVAIKRDPGTGRYTYLFQTGNGVGTELIAFDQDDVVPFQLFNPNKLERGYSRMEAIRSTIFSEESSRESQNSMWKNAGRPNMVLETPNRLGRAGRERLKIAFDQDHAGSRNAGSTLVLEDGVTAKAVQVTAVDLQLIESRKINREEIAAVFDIAPTLIGILEHATFSNVTEQMRGFYRDTMAPVIEFIQSVMDKYVGSNWPRKNVMRFAVDEVIRGDYEVRVEAAHKGIATGVMTPNEARDLIGLNRYEDPKADLLYANSAIQPLGTPAEQIRLMGNIDGDTTPNGTDVAPPTPVASLDGSKPTSVNAPKPIPAKPGGKQPNNLTPSSNKHYRAIKGQVGRGKSQEEIVAFAYKLYTEHEDELDDIMTAVHLAMAERSRKANN
jgi:hypothetical protein